MSTSNDNQQLIPVDERGVSSIHVDVNTDNSDVMAYISFNYYGLICTGVKLIRGKQGLFLKYPSKLLRNGERNGYMFPVNRFVRSAIENAVFAEYEQTKKEILEKLNN